MHHFPSRVYLASSLTGEAVILSTFSRVFRLIPASVANCSITLPLLPCGKITAGFAFPAFIRASACRDMMSFFFNLSSPFWKLFRLRREFWLSIIHTIAASRSAKSRPVVVIHRGTRRDAILWRVRANATHGMPRTNADKRRAVETLLRDEEWARWTDNKLARTCAVSNHFVSDVKKSLGIVPSENRKYETKHGTIATMNTANIGKKKETVVVNTETGGRGWRRGILRAHPVRELRGRAKV